MTRDDLFYIAGLLEGEGCFTWQRCSRNGKDISYGGVLIDVKMVDKDIIDRYRQIVGATANQQKHKPSTPNSQTQYGQRISGHAAASLMRELLPLMGVRRSNRIRFLLEKWDNRPAAKKKKGG